MLSCLIGIFILLLQSQWKMESMETLAIKLSKNLLCETFPNFPRDVLLDVFSAHNYSFNDTLEVLLASSNDAQVHEVMTPEALSEHNQRLLQNAIQESKNVRSVIYLILNKFNFQN